MKKRGTIVIIIGLIVITCSGILLAWRYGLFHRSTSNPVGSTLEKHTTSTEPSAQSDFNNGQPRKEATQSRLNEGSISDNSGVITSTPPESAWMKSSDGQSVVVYSPSQNQILKSGSQLTGTSLQKKVSFRLIDDIQGVVAQGTLDVVDGKFSGIFNFSTEGSQGQVDVFTTNLEGVEQNNVSVPVRFR